MSSSVSAHLYQVRMTKLGHVVPHVFDEQLLFESPGMRLVLFTKISNHEDSNSLTNSNDDINKICCGVSLHREQGGCGLVGVRGGGLLWPSAYHAQEAGGGQGWRLGMGGGGGAVLGSQILPQCLSCTQTSPCLCSAEKVPFSAIDPHLWLLQMKLVCQWLESSMPQNQLLCLHVSSSSSCHSS